MTLANFTVELPNLDQNRDGKICYDEFSAFFGPTAIPYSGAIRRPRHASKKAAKRTPKTPVKKAATSPKKPAPRKEPMGVIVNTTPARQLVEPKAESSSSGSDWSCCSGSDCGSDTEGSACGSYQSTSPSMPEVARTSQRSTGTLSGAFPSREGDKTTATHVKPSPRSVGSAATPREEVTRAVEGAIVTSEAHAKPSTSSTATPREEIRFCEDAHAVGAGLADGRGSAAASRCEDCPASIVSEVVEVDDGIQEPSELTAPSHMLQHTTTSPSFGDLCSSAAVETIPHADTSSRALFGRRILSLGEDIAPCQPAGIRGFNDNASRRRLSIDQALELGRVDRCRPVIVPL